MRITTRATQWFASRFPLWASWLTLGVASGELIASCRPIEKTWQWGILATCILWSLFSIISTWCARSGSSGRFLEMMPMPSKIESELLAGGRVVSSAPLELRIAAIHVTLFSGRECVEQLNEALGGGPLPATMSEILRRIPPHLALVIHVETVDQEDVARFLAALHAAQQIYSIGIAVIGPEWIHTVDRSVLGSTFGGSATHCRASNTGE